MLESHFIRIVRLTGPSSPVGGLGISRLESPNDPEFPRYPAIAEDVGLADDEDSAVFLIVKLPKEVE